MSYSGLAKVETKHTTNSVSFIFSTLDIVAVAGSASAAPEYRRIAELIPLV